MTLVKLYKPRILVLLATKTVDHNKITEDLGFNSQILSAAIDLSESKVIMWKKEDLKLDNISVTLQSIHIIVKVITPLNS